MICIPSAATYFQASPYYTQQPWAPPYSPEDGQDFAAPDWFTPTQASADSWLSLADIARGRTSFDQLTAGAETTRPATHPQINPKKIHMTQTYDPKYNRGGSSHSGDCVPTSLTMAFKAIGMGPKGGSVQDKIDRVRYKMAHGAGNDRDGVDSQGRRSSSEHGNGMFLSDVRRGARRYGVKTKNTRNTRDVANQVMAGNPVVLFGSNGGDIYAKKHKGSFHTFFNGNHGILVSGYDPKTKKFTINDPLSHGGPIQITRNQLRDFMGKNDGEVDGIALQRPQN